MFLWGETFCNFGIAEEQKFSLVGNVLTEQQNFCCLVRNIFLCGSRGACRIFL